MDRRVFGEFVGRRANAFGWTTGPEPHIARLSIGIGVVNAGIGTFHALVVKHDEDLPFVWWVADHAMIMVEN